ncbi:uncharacterized protein O3C94_008328 isoform 2-T2 [Discoglossus pictus]
MDVPKLLLILWCLHGRTQSDSPKPYCTEQLEALRVKVGGSVTIPCWISFPHAWDNSTDVKVYWREGREAPCGNATFIYNNTEQWIHEKYRERISFQENLKEFRNMSITIHGLKATDGPLFCCRVTLINGNKQLVEWQNQPGTFLLYTDHSQFHVQQVDSVPAFTGEHVTIPCHVHYPAETKETLQKVTWRIGQNNLCRDNTQSIGTWSQDNMAAKPSRFSLVRFPHDVSLRIENVSYRDENRYCCEVTTPNKTRRSTHGTVLGVENKDSASPPGITVDQAPHTSATEGGSVILNCSFSTTNSGEHPLVRIYWKVGSPSGPYAYHPNQEIIHPSYQGRTRLRGQADLHIWDVRMTDNTSYHCFVMLRFCVGLNKFDSLTSRGKGTILHVEGMESNLVVIICLAVLLVFLILCALLIFLKKRGIICKNSSNKNHLNPPPSNMALTKTSTLNNDSAHAREPDNSGEPEDTGGILYAKLEISSQNKKGPVPQVNYDQQVIYATVKGANPVEDTE